MYKIILLTGIISLLLTINNSKYTANISTRKHINTSFPYIKKEQNIGLITIKKIKLEKPLYDINSSENNIEKNVTIKDYDEDNNFFLIMAHSGSGPKAFFKDLNKLKINDQIIITYNYKSYLYTITDISYQQKTGTISINKESNTLVLTTCENNNTQLIIYAKNNPT